jgi:magnesium chelatase family protein
VDGLFEYRLFRRCLRETRTNGSGKATRRCRCGHLADASQACGRAPRCAADYQAKISGPLIDRIDIHVEVGSVSAADLSLPPPAEDSAHVAARVTRARDVQRKRYANAGVRTNAEIEGELLDEVAKPDGPGQKLLVEAAERMKLTARGYHRVLRVARTIADLNADEAIARPHIAEALSYRRVAQT